MLQMVQPSHRTDCPAHARRNKAGMREWGSAQFDWCHFGKARKLWMWHRFVNFQDGDMSTKLDGKCWPEVRPLQWRNHGWVSPEGRWRRRLIWKRVSNILHMRSENMSAQCNAWFRIHVTGIKGECESWCSRKKKKPGPSEKKGRMSDNTKWRFLNMLMD